MNKIFKNAIQGIGGLARLALPSGGQSDSFAASIHPAGFEGDGHSPQGAGRLKCFKIYMEYSEVTKQIGDGDIISYLDRSYAIKSVSPSYYGGKAVYISGTITLCEEENA